MAGIFEWLARSQKMAEQCDPMAMELQTAKEILAEVFGVRVSEVDEMISSRFEAAGNEDIVLEENVLWPQEFQQEERKPNSTGEHNHNQRFRSQMAPAH